MTHKLQIDDKFYEVEYLSEQANKTLTDLQFSTKKIEELENMKALLQRAKNSYIEKLKLEMLSQKAGLVFDDE